MLNFSQIEQVYPEQLHRFKPFLLREYLQYKILALLFKSEYAMNFVFLGGTCLRIVHDSHRFSEDLDFDNFNVTTEDFEKVSTFIKTGLQREGLEVEMQQVYRGAYHCYIRFPKLLYQTGLSGHKEAKILIQLDTEPQNFEYKPENHLLTKFDVFGNIRTTPIDVLLAQKMTAFVQRKQPKGRDIYDITFLCPKTRPNYDYLSQCLDVNNPKELKEVLMNRLNTLDLNRLSHDVSPFLFNPNDTQRIFLFSQFVQQTQF
jgi:predicted nucleotidyltransferase component of viral defense system